MVISPFSLFPLFFSLTNKHSFCRFKFDDDRVIPATLNEVLEANFGGQTQQTDPKYRHVKRHTNAYMLVYVRESDQDQVLAEVTSNDIPTHLGKAFSSLLSTRKEEKLTFSIVL